MKKGKKGKGKERTRDKDENTTYRDDVRRQRAKNASNVHSHLNGE